MKFKKILIVKNDKIGDMVLSTNIFRELKKNLPHSEITAIVSSANKPLIEKNKNIDKMITLDYPPKNLKSLSNYISTSKIIKKENFDLGIDLRGSIFNIFFLLTMPKVKYKVGFYNRSFSKYFLNYAYKKDRKRKHVTSQRIDLMNKALKLNSKDYWPEIATDKEDEIITNKFIKTNQLKKFICILPDASTKEKQWPLEKWDKLIRYIKEKYPTYRVLLLGTDQDKISFLLKRNPRTLTPSKPLNLRSVYLLFKKSSLIISHDSGPMHLAWTSKAKLIALISGYKHRSKDLSKLNYVKPLGKNSITIYKDMKDIDIKEVRNKIDELL